MSSNDLTTPYVRNAINLNRLSNKAANKAVDIYVRAAKQVLKEFADTDEYGGTERQMRRLQAQADQIQKTLEKSMKEGYDGLLADLRDIAQYEADWQQSTLEQAVGVPGFEVHTVEVTEEYIEALAANELKTALKTDAGQTIQGSLPQIMPADAPDLNKIFLDLTSRSSETLVNSIKQNLLLGKTPDQIRRFLLKGNKIPNGSPLKKTERALKGVIRTAVNGVANETRINVIRANKSITNQVIYRATLDSVTTFICATTDGKIFDVDDPQRPQPPLHFQCRSQLAPYIPRDFWESRGLTPPPQGTRASKGASGGKQVDAEENYETWLRKQPREFIEKTLGKGKAEAFIRGESLSSFVRNDGAETTTEELREQEKLPPKETKPKDIPNTDAKYTPEYIRDTPLMELGKGYRQVIQDTVRRQREVVVNDSEWRKINNNIIRKVKTFKSKFKDLSPAERLKISNAIQDLRQQQLVREAKIKPPNNFLEPLRVRAREAAKRKGFDIDNPVNLLDDNPLTIEAEEHARDFHNLVGGFKKETNYHYSDRIKLQGKINLKRDRDRAYASVTDNSVNVGSGEKWVVFHEMGHHLEHRLPGLVDEAVAFVKRNATSKVPQKLSEITGNKNYRDSEKAYPGNFFDPYIGKIYESATGRVQATEVIAMGMQNFVDEDTAEKFIKDHPEHADLILGALLKNYED